MRNLNEDNITRAVLTMHGGGGGYLDSDAVFGVRSSLVADWVERPARPTPDGGSSDIPFYTLDFDFVLAPARDAVTS